MTKEEFKPIARKMRLAYKRDGFLDDKEQMALWLALLDDMDAKRVDRAAESFIKRSQFPPTIADLRAECERVKNEESAERTQLLEIYGETKGVYPCSYDNKETRVLWNRTVSKIAEAKGLSMIDAAWVIKNTTFDYVQQAERRNKVDYILDWIDFLRSAENWATKQN